MNVRNTKGTQFLALASVVALSAAPAYAGFSQADAVTMGGQPVFRILAGAEGFSAEHRAWLAQDALDNALVRSADKSPSAVTVERRNGAIIVAFGGYKVATADAISARDAGMSPQLLANQWAEAIKNFVASDKAADYIASLKSPNQLGASIAIVEKKLYAPAGTVLPVAFTEELNSATCHVGQKVEAKITQDVMLGSYAIPANTLVIGQLVETTPGELCVTFNTLRTPSGTELPISASVSEAYLVRTNGPHTVCTLGIPANPYANARVPANIGIGAIGGTGTSTLAFHRGETRVIALGQPFSVVLDNVTPVAVVTRSTAM